MLHPAKIMGESQVHGYGVEEHGGTMLGSSGIVLAPAPRAIVLEDHTDNRVIAFE